MFNSCKKLEKILLVNHNSDCNFEYMFLECILLFILAITFSCVRELDYSIFSSFLILTPTYQLLYAIIIILIILVLGVLYNERVLKKLNRK